VFQEVLRNILGPGGSGLQHAVLYRKAEGVPGGAEEHTGPEREDVTGEWRKVHSEELHDLYCSPSDEVREEVMGGVCGMHTEEKKLEQCFCRKI
jgi:hypothetical protein